MASKRNVLETEQEALPRRLCGIMRDQHVTQDALANYLGVTRQAVGQYTQGRSAPDWKMIVKMAGFFGVTTDYLLGLSDLKTRDPQLKDACEYTGLSEQAATNLASIKEGLYPFDTQTIDLFLEAQDSFAFFAVFKRVYDLYQRMRRELAGYSEKIKEAEQDPVSLLKLHDLLEGTQTDSLVSMRKEWFVAMYEYSSVCTALFSDLEKELLESLHEREQELRDAIGSQKKKGAGDDGGHAQS